MIPNHKWVKPNKYLRNAVEGQKCFIAAQGKVFSATVAFGFFGARWFERNGVAVERYPDCYVDGACDRKSDLSEKPVLK